MDLLDGMPRLAVVQSKDLDLTLGDFAEFGFGKGIILNPPVDNAKSLDHSETIGMINTLPLIMNEISIARPLARLIIQLDCFLELSLLIRRSRFSRQTIDGDHVEFTERSFRQTETFTQRLLGLLESLPSQKLPSV